MFCITKIVWVFGFWFIHTIQLELFLVIRNYYYKKSEVVLWKENVVKSRKSQIFKNVGMIRFGIYLKNSILCISNVATAYH